ncbi:MAG TPA: ArsR family transcriptional regulator [Dehalococcoidia bacterium]|nr:ArsR family transcriptional regulator [Dehalococcoidia bacterium]
MRDLVKVYKALSDESRLRVLNLLFEKECCVCEVMQALEISQSKASRILSALYDVGFLNLRKDGLWSLYSIDWDEMGVNLKEILEATRKGFEGNKQMEADCEQLKTAVRVGPGCINTVCKTRLTTKASQA